MNKFKIVVLILVQICISCSKKREVELIFKGNKNDFWAYQDDCWGTKGIYFQFKNDGNSDKYRRHISKGFIIFNNDGDLQNGQTPWSLKNDSIFVFDNEEYKIEKISNEEILLSYYHYKIKDKKCFVKLTKWVDGPEGPKPLKPLKEK